MNRKKGNEDLMDLVKTVFKSAGYEFIEEKPKNRLLFMDVDINVRIQFWMDKDADLSKAIVLIAKRAYEKGRFDGENEIKQSIKDILGIK